MEHHSFRLTSVAPSVAASIFWALRRRRVPALYTPHLSPLIFSAREILVLRILERLSLVEYFDDGMALTSQRGILWKQGYIRSKPDQLLGWDYSFLPWREANRCASVIASYETLGSIFCQARLGRPCHFQRQTSPTERYDVVMASKWLDTDKYLSDHHAPSTRKIIYIPHYRDHKNCEALMGMAILWEPQPNLELGLPAAMVSIERCYFGVSSSIFYVLEVLLKQQAQIDTEFIPLLNLEAADYPEEGVDFLDGLKHYAQWFRIRPNDQPLRLDGVT